MMDLVGVGRTAVSQQEPVEGDGLKLADLQAICTSSVRPSVKG